jgi:hypothetical protein
MGFTAWGTYWLVAFFYSISSSISSESISSEIGLAASMSVSHHVTDFLPVAPVILATTALMTMLLAIEAVHLLLKRRGRHASA